MKSSINFLLSLLIVISIFSCSSTKKTIIVENKSLKSFIDTNGINDLNNFIDSTKIENLSLNDLKIIHSNIQNSNTINEKKVLIRILSLEKNKNKYLKYSLYLAKIYSILDDNYSSDSIFESSIKIVRKEFTDSNKYLSEIYYNFASVKLNKNNLKISRKLFIKSLHYATLEKDSLQMVENYTKLNEIYYYSDVIRSSLLYYYKAFPIRISFKEYEKSMDLTSKNFMFFKSKGLKLYRFKNQVTVLDSISPTFDTRNKIKYLLLKSNYIDNIDNKDKKLLVYYKELDSIYKTQPSIFSNFVSDYVETFFPILNKLGKITEANNLMQSVLKDYNISKDSIVNEETVNMAFWAYNTGQFSKSQQLFKKALKEYEEKYGKESPIVAELLDKIGVMYLSSGLTLEAYNFFDRALDIKEKYSGGDYLSIGISFNNIAESYRVGGKYRLAEKNYYLAINSWEKLDADSTNMWLTKAFHNLGVLYTDMGIYDTAKISLDKAYKYKKKIFGADSPELIYTYIALGKLYFKVGQYDSSLVAYNKSKKIIDKNGLTNTLFDLSYHIGSGLLYAFMGTEDKKAKENLLYAERYILGMKGGNQGDRLLDIRKILFNIAKRENDEKEQKRISIELYGKDNWDD